MAFAEQLFRSFDYQTIMRLAFAFGAGALVGIERECRGRPAGLRTHILVSLGAAVVTLISTKLAMTVPGGTELIRADPGRIAAGVVTGIGFLGAGAIIRIGVTARGLTTAASLWCMAGVGMGFGLGFYGLSILATLLMLLALTSLASVEKKVSRNWYKTVEVVMTGSESHISDMIEQFKARGYRVLDIKLTKDKSVPEFTIEYELRLNDKADVKDIVDMMDQTQYVQKYRLF